MSDETTTTILDLRDRIRALLENDNLEVTGCGYCFFEGEADISFRAGKHTYWLTLREA